jgi:hypothetical protein
MLFDPSLQKLRRNAEHPEEHVLATVGFDREHLDG